MIKLYRYGNNQFVNTFLNINISDGKSKLFKKRLLKLFYNSLYLYQKYDILINTKRSIFFLLKAFKLNRNFNISFLQKKRKRYVNNRKKFFYNLDFFFLKNNNYKSIFFLKFFRFFFLKKNYKHNFIYFLKYNFLITKRVLLYKIYKKKLKRLFFIKKKKSIR